MRRSNGRGLETGALRTAPALDPTALGRVAGEAETRKPARCRGAPANRRFMSPGETGDPCC